LTKYLTGVYKLSENATNSTDAKVNQLSKNYEAIAISYEVNFKEFMTIHNITEYGTDEQQKKQLTLYLGTNMALITHNISTANDGLGDQLRTALAIKIPLNLARKTLYKAQPTQLSLSRLNTQIF
jgi:hypothetical protein